jgi:PKD repeat protein
MKKLFSLFFSLLLSSLAFSQTCTIEPWSLEKRIHLSDVVAEGRIIQKQGVWLEGKRRIYTLYTMEVYKLFKGSLAADGKLYFVSEGGQIGNEMHEAHPSLHLEMQDLGIILLNEQPLSFHLVNKPEKMFKPTASTQSFIAIDEHERKAFDHQNQFEGLNGFLYHELTKITGADYTVIKTASHDGKPGLKPLSNPIITSFNVDTITAGTGSILTINGSNFGSSRGTNGEVEFRDANFGDNRFYTIPFDDNYVSWSDTRIQVKVPTRAGTGTIRVTNNNNERGLSSKTIVIPYGHLNVSYQVDEKFYEPDHVDDNNKGGYTWQMNHKFKLRTDAVNAMLRSLETWRCNTLMNWEVGADTHIDSIGRDNINVIRMTEFDDNKLGVCWSFWSGCWNGNAFDWYVNELDIEFDSTHNWYYGTGNPGNNQYDFETVATHELGHGHQLAHVIDASKVMHFSLGRGQRKTVLTTDDVESGEAMMAKSTTAHVCGPAVLKAIRQNDCNITRPKASFTISKNVACPGDALFLNDQTEGVVNSYMWTLDATASSSSLSGKGPHQISYNQEGSKMIRLVATNNFGSDTAFVSLTVLPPPPDTPGAILAADTLCVGLNAFSIDSVTRAEEYVWNLISGGLIIGDNSGLTANASLGTVGGPYSMTVKAKNTCGESAARQHSFMVVPKVAAGFTESIDGRTVTFTNSSSNATRYKWFFGDGDSSELMNPVYEYEDAWTFDVLLYAYNQCSYDSVIRQIRTVNPASVRKVAPLGIHVYPNPSSGELHIQGLQKGHEIMLTDMQGRLVKHLTVSESEHLLDLNDLVNGSYILRIRDNNGSVLSEVIQLVR